VATRPRPRTVSLLVVGILLGSLLATPAGAHVGGTVAHLWTKHIRPLSKQIFYTKAQANKRFQKKCKPGSVLAFAYVRGTALSPSDFTTTGVTRQFNCAGGSIKGQAFDAGNYVLKIPGIKAAAGGTSDGLVATLTAADHDWRVMSYDVHAVHDYIEINAARPDTAALAHAQFVITVYRAP
jgi:hypothetical protein